VNNPIVQSREVQKKNTRAGCRLYYTASAATFKENTITGFSNTHGMFVSNLNKENFIFDDLLANIQIS